MANALPRLKPASRTLALASPDFQDTHGYDKDAPGEANLSLTNWVGHTFGCLAFTLEMPFKVNDNLPDDDYGWSSQRSASGWARPC